MKIIAITGTPGTGKSTLAKLLEKRLKFKRINLHRYYKQLSTGYNQSKKSYNLDLKKFKQLIKEKAKTNNLIIDSHIAHLLPKSMVDLCIVLTCSNLKLLEKRLKKRKYSSSKIKENLEAEIFQICLQEAKEKGHLTITIDDEKPTSTIFKQIVKALNRH